MAEPCILVTGGAGFIGCALGAHLATRHQQVVAIDNLLEQVHPSGSRPEQLSPSVLLFEGDVRDPFAWDQVLSNFMPETIIHLAAETGTAQSLSEASRHSSVNVTGTTQMLDALARR